MSGRSIVWQLVVVAALAVGGCASQSQHPLHVLAASEYNIVAPSAIGGGAGDWSAWPNHDLNNDPLRYDFGYQLSRYAGGGSPSSYALAHWVYTPEIYGYPGKGGGIRPYRHHPVPIGSAYSPRRYTYYPGVPGYRSHGTQTAYGYRSYGYGRSRLGPIGGGLRSGIGFPRQ